jgi:hypothetical protein
MIRRFRWILPLFLLAAGCGSRAYDLRNPDDGSPVLAGSGPGIAVRGGGSASTRRWDRRALLSLSVRNDRQKDLTLAREAIGIRLGLRSPAANSLVGSGSEGRVEQVRVPALGSLGLIAEFSADFAARKSGKITLDFVEADTKEKVRVDVPFRMERTKAP